MTSRTDKTRSCYAVGLSVRQIGVRTAWSRPISARADVKLAPCMARPNLFSGD